MTTRHREIVVCSQRAADLGFKFRFLTTTWQPSVYHASFYPCMFPCESSPCLPLAPGIAAVLFSCSLNAFFSFISSPLPAPHRLTFWAKQKAAMPTGQKQHSTEKTAKPRWSWGRSGERRLSPSQSESLSLDASYRQERAWVGISHLPCPNPLLCAAPKDQHQGLPRNTKTKNISGHRL